MSKYQQRDNSGALFKNVEKRSENGPDYSGNCMIDGVEYFFDAWLKASESGRKWMSFSFKRKDKQPSSPPVPQKTHGDRPGGPKNRTAPAHSFEAMPDDVPF